MSVSDTRVVDSLGIDKVSGECVLTIVDHLAWDDPEHLLTLQEKLNTYLAFIESGEIEEHVPNARAGKIRINIVAANEPSEEAVDFLSQAQDVIRGAGFEFAWEVWSGDV